MKPDRGLQRPAVPVAQPREDIDQRMDHLVQPRETHVRFELDAGSPQHPSSLRRRSYRGGIEEHRLAHAGIAGDEQNPAIDSC